MPSPYDPVARELKALVDTHGRSLFDDRRRLIGLLLDHLPEARREVRTLATAIGEGVAAALVVVDRPLAGITIDRQATRLGDEAALRPDIARDVTRTIAYALGLGPEPRVYAASDIAVPPPAQPVYHVQPAHAPPPPSSPLADPKARRAAILGGALAVAAVVVIVPQLVDQQATPTAQAPATPSDATAGFAGELADFGIPAQPTLQANVGSPTPLAIPVGKRVTTDDVRAMQARDNTVVLIDVLANSHPQTIAGARYLARAGEPGNFDDSVQAQLDASLRQLIPDRTASPIVFFCAGAQCWESYNAALRAHRLGYRDVRWYRGGLASWAEARAPMMATPAAEDAKPPQ